jgi:two-component system nitrogen regulation sensor histidine kinase NtrY
VPARGFHMADLSGFTSRPGKDGSRTRRYVLATIAFLFLGLIATQLFLRQTSVGSPRFVRMTFFLWAATVTVILALLILATVLGRNLIKLYFERRSGQVGSRFKTMVVTTFVVLSFLPAVLLFLLAYGLINFSIEQWFSAPAAQMLENSRAIAQRYYDELRLDAQRYAAVVAADIKDEQALYAQLSPGLEQSLNKRRSDFGIQYLGIFASNGALVAKSGTRVPAAEEAVRTKALVARALGGSIDAEIERVKPDDPLREVVRAAVPIRNQTGRIIGAVLTENALAEAVNFRAYSVTE